MRQAGLTDLGRPTGGAQVILLQRAVLLRVLGEALEGVRRPAECVRHDWNQATRSIYGTAQATWAECESARIGGFINQKKLWLPSRLRGLRCMCLMQWWRPKMIHDALSRPKPRLRAG